MTAYYNENDAHAAQWLRNLVDAGHIAPGVVDDRSIEDVSADDVRGFTQCHWFAGIGGWSLALRLAGWPDDQPVWTGSCPCQPFSAAGKRAGVADPRHLWPTWWRILEECRPATVFGEQVGSRDGLAWFDAVCADLESGGYAVGSADLPAASVGAPHKRQRLWFVADRAIDTLANAPGIGRERRAGEASDQPRAQRRSQRLREAGILADADSEPGRQGGALDGGGHPRGDEGSRSGPGGGGVSLGVGDAESERLREEGYRDLGRPAPRPGERRQSDWDAVEWVPCRDGVARPTQPGVSALAHGVPGRVGRLRAYGNAIIPQVAAAFIRSARGAIA